jgi:hypothetical protein
MRGTQVKNYWLVCPSFLGYNSLLNSERATMNNRILEIAHQVLPREDDLIEADHKEYAYFFSSHELQQFAELIVRECADIATNRYQRLMDGGKAIKQHFGVEEQEKVVSKPKCSVCGTTENVKYVGGHQPYLCDSEDCIPF